MVPEISTATEIVILGHFCPFTHITARKIEMSKKIKKNLEISSFYTNVPKIMVICYTVPENLCVTDVIIFHFGLFFTLSPPPPPPPTPLKAQKTETSQKWKKWQEIPSFYTSAPKIMIIGYTVPEICCMMDVIVIFHFGLFFCPFTPLTAWKIKISKKWKKHLQISSFYTSVPKTSEYMLYCSWDMARDGCNCCFSFWAIFCPFTSLTVQKITILKNERNPSRYHHFVQVY